MSAVAVAAVAGSRKQQGLLIGMTMAWQDEGDDCDKAHEADKGIHPLLPRCLFFRSPCLPTLTNWCGPIL